MKLFFPETEVYSANWRIYLSFSNIRIYDKNLLITFKYNCTRFCELGPHATIHCCLR